MGRVSTAPGVLFGAGNGEKVGNESGAILFRAPACSLVEVTSKCRGAALGVVSGLGVVASSIGGPSLGADSPSRSVGRKFESRAGALP